MSTFISGLREEIQANVCALCSTTLEEAFEKAERMEQKHKALKMVEKQHELKVKLSKCLWGEQQVYYLGHIISTSGIATDLGKIACMMELSTPKNPKELREFLGLTGYYKQFATDYEKIAAPLTPVLRKDKFIWSEKAIIAFEALKTAMTVDPVLALLDFTK
ncbi:uncharacterized mitochondrial protein AtMg00860-like [Typha latifolia]|uniref:uncharacterized mitochondrial protein AtMg00860-like n=1 Tax=Typha latifolia TaxID=4733 RepID=UPI003C2FDED9